MPKVEFIKSWTVKQGDGKGPVYAAGDIVDLERSYADKYINRGLAKAYAEMAPDSVALNQKVPDRDGDSGAVEIPEGWRDRGWPELRSLAARVTSDPVRSKDDAIAAIELEMERRTQSTEDDQKDDGKAEE